jgi:hypothetical protein
MPLVPWSNMLSLMNAIAEKAPGLVQDEYGGLD